MKPLKPLFWIPPALCFLAFGIFMLTVSYQQDNPIVFIALFFSSSLIILLCAALILGLILRFSWDRKNSQSNTPDTVLEDIPSSEDQNQID